MNIFNTNSNSEGYLTKIINGLLLYLYIFGQFLGKANAEKNNNQANLNNAVSLANSGTPVHGLDLGHDLYKTIPNSVNVDFHSGDITVHNPNEYINNRPNLLIFNTIGSDKYIIEHSNYSLPNELRRFFLDGFRSASLYQDKLYYGGLIIGVEGKFTKGKFVSNLDDIVGCRELHPATEHVLKLIERYRGSVIVTKHPRFKKALLKEALKKEILTKENRVELLEFKNKLERCAEPDREIGCHYGYGEYSESSMIKTVQKELKDPQYTPQYDEKQINLQKSELEKLESDIYVLKDELKNFDTKNRDVKLGCIKFLHNGKPLYELDPSKFNWPQKCRMLQNYIVELIKLDNNDIRHRDFVFDSILYNEKTGAIQVNDFRASWGWRNKLGVDINATEYNFRNGYDIGGTSIFGGTQDITIYYRNFLRFFFKDPVDVSDTLNSYVDNHLDKHYDDLFNNNYDSEIRKDLPNCPPKLQQQLSDIPKKLQKVVIAMFAIHKKVAVGISIDTINDEINKYLNGRKDPFPKLKDVHKMNDVFKHTPTHEKRHKQSKHQYKPKH